MSLIRRSFAAHWKLLMISVAVIAVGLAIALPTSLARAHRTAGPVTAPPGNATSINGWKLTFAFPGDEAISSAWNTTFTQTDGRVSATNTNYDATIPRGASQSLGFLRTWTFNDTAPTRFSVNGMACT